MRIAIGSDERSHLTDFVARELPHRDFGVQPSGALDGSAPPADGQPGEGVNIPCPSLRSTSEIVVRETLAAWFSTAADPGEREDVEKVSRLEERHRPVAKAGAAVSLASGEKGTV